MIPLKDWWHFSIVFKLVLLRLKEAEAEAEAKENNIENLYIYVIQIIIRVRAIPHPFSVPKSMKHSSDSEI